MIKLKTLGGDGNLDHFSQNGETKNKKNLEY